MENSSIAIGVDVGGSHFCSAAVDMVSGEMAGTPVVTPVDSRADASVILDALVSNITDTVKASGAASVKGVGLAFPGPFDYVHGISTVEGVDKYEKIFGLDVASSLRQRLSSAGIDRFRFLNDAAAFALGECFGGAAKGADRVVGITLGTGVGSGFVAGHKLVESGDEVPAYGWVYHLPFEGGIADEAFSTRWICRRYHELTGQTVSGAKEVVDQYDQRQEARDLFSEYGKRFADFMAPVLMKFRADMLVLGGNISRAWDLFSKEFTDGLRGHGCCTEIRISELRDKAAIIGAASLFVETE